MTARSNSGKDQSGYERLLSALKIPSIDITRPGDKVVCEADKVIEPSETISEEESPSNVSFIWGGNLLIGEVSGFLVCYNMVSLILSKTI